MDVVQVDDAGQVLRCTMGTTRCYNIERDAYEWEACEVMAWDEEQLTFLVRMTSGMVKHVKRMNLRFTAPEEEEEEDFTRRLEHVKAQRAEAESMLRYHHYLETTGDDSFAQVRMVLYSVHRQTTRPLVESTYD
jgi:hypothetical protein